MHYLARTIQQAQPCPLAFDQVFCSYRTIGASAEHIQYRCCSTEVVRTQAVEPAFCADETSAVVQPRGRRLELYVYEQHNTKPSKKSRSSIIRYCTSIKPAQHCSSRYGLLPLRCHHLDGDQRTQITISNPHLCRRAPRPLQSAHSAPHR